jgi:excisionase family DNA binding protein
MIKDEDVMKLRKEVAEEEQAKIYGINQVRIKLNGKSIADLLLLKAHWQKKIKENRGLDLLSTKKRKEAKIWLEAIEEAIALGTDEPVAQPESSKLGNPDNMTVQETARYLGLSESTIYKMTSKNDIPHSKVGGKKLSFSKETLDQYIRNKRNKTNKDIQDEAEYLLANRSLKKANKGKNR